MDKKLEISILYDVYKGLLTEKQADAIDFYYNNDLSLSEIGENIGISRQGVRDAIVRAQTVLLEAEEKLGLCKRVTDLEQGIQRIKDNTYIIYAENQKTVYSQNIYEAATEILNIISSLEDKE